ncbi:hypothetical protein B0H14DRAFT_3152821 [Mycena olivaceomarginata]|nr:hypothetical protein B0H14DRAFT_3152821 [Mycena olivaceomarginata]
MSPAIDVEFLPVVAELPTSRPFSMNSASQLQHRMIGLGDSGTHLRFIRAQYCEKKAPLLHEFIIVWYALSERVENYFIAERHRSDRYQFLFGSGAKSIEVIQCQAIRPLPDPQADGTRTVKSINLASRPSTDMASRSAQSSSDFISSGSYYAEDSISISNSRTEGDVQKLEGEYTVLAEIRAPENCTLTAAELIVLAATITAAMPLYKLLATQCFLYGRIFWYMLVKLLKGADPGRDGHIASARKNGGGQYISAVKMKSHVDARVTSELKKLNIVAAHESSWKAFTAECRKTREEMDRPLNEARQREQESRRRQQEAELREEAAKAEIARLREQLRQIEGASFIRLSAATPVWDSSSNWSS